MRLLRRAPSRLASRILCPLDHRCGLSGDGPRESPKAQKTQRAFSKTEPTCSPSHRPIGPECGERARLFTCRSSCPDFLRKATDNQKISLRHFSCRGQGMRPLRIMQAKTTAAISRQRAKNATTATLRKQQNTEE